MDSLSVKELTSVGWWGEHPEHIDLNASVPFTVEEYKKLEGRRFNNNYIPLLFTIESPTMIGLPPKILQEVPEHLEFRLTVFTYLFQNRFWRPANDLHFGQNTNYMSINFQGVEHNDLPKVHMKFLETVIFEMAMYHFGYDFTEYPHEKFSEESYAQYETWCNEMHEKWNEESGLEFNVASKKTVKQVLLAVEYLHFIDRFRYAQATTLMANPRLVGDFNYWWKWNYTDSIEKEKEELKKKIKVLQTTLSRIDLDILMRMGSKGSVGGQLSSEAILIWKHWVSSQGKEEIENQWGIWQAVYGVQK